MNTKKFKMDLLNPEEMKNVNGGDCVFKCNQKNNTVTTSSNGDTIIVCMNGELSCKPSVSTCCDHNSVSVNGCEIVTLKPIWGDIKK